MKNIYLLIIIYSLFIPSYAQEEKINQTDAQGRKQGYWQKTYENGNLKYEGYFKNDNPVDTLKRYFEDGTLKALMIFNQEGDSAYAYLFFEDGKLSAEGRYVQSLKDGPWKYYSSFFEALVQEENYILGKKHGVSLTYYPSGNISEYLEHKNDIKDGEWIQYFEDGQVKFKARYAQNKLNGEYILYFPNGKTEIAGYYMNDLKDGVWKYNDEQGNLHKELIYHHGIAENEEELKAIQQKYFDLIEQNNGKFQEPDATF